MTILLLLPSFLDCLRTTFGVRFMSYYAVTACSIWWMVRVVKNGRLGLRWSPLYVVLLLLMLAAFFSVTSPIGSPGAKLYRALSFSYTRLFMVALIINLLQTRAQVRRMLYGLVGLSTLSALVAIWQFAMYQWAGQIHSFAEGEQVFRITLQATYLRATGLAVDPNEIGIYMAVAGVLVLSLGVYRPDLGLPGRVGHLLVLAILAGGVLVTFSRSALAALLLFGSLAPLVVPTRWLLPTLATYAVAGLAFVASGELRGAMDALSDASGDVLFRVEANRLGLRAMAEYPITGVGVDSFTNFNNPFDLPVHNLFLQMGSEMGIPGLLFFCILIGTQLARVLAAAWTTRDASTRALVVALGLGYLAKLFAHLTNPILTDLFFWFLVGATERGVLLESEARAPAASRRAATDGS